MKNTFILFLVVLLGCSESELLPEDDFFGYEYFPVASGQYRLFEVQETNYLLSGEVVTEVYQLKEEINTLKIKYDADISILELAALQISSTDIRKRINLGELVKYFLNKNVENYIEKKRLYR